MGLRPSPAPCEPTERRRRDLLPGLSVYDVEMMRYREDEDRARRTLSEAAELARRTVPGASDAALTLLRGRTLLTVASTGDRPWAADRLHLTVGEGPFLSAPYDAGAPLLVSDMLREQRWRTWSAFVCELELRSMLSQAIETGRQESLRLTVYAPGPGTFDDAEVMATLNGLSEVVRAASAAVTAPGGDLFQAFCSRSVIAQAQGILRERHHVSAEQATGFLVLAARQARQTVYDVALTLIESGDLPPFPLVVAQARPAT